MIDFLNFYKFNRLTKVGIAGLIIGALFKILHWPGANLILLISFIWVSVSHFIHFVQIRPKRTIDYAMLLLVVSFMLYQAISIFHWPHRKTALFLFAGAALFFFLSYLFSSIESNQSKTSLSIAIAKTLSSISIIIGALFKILHWPGAQIMLITGMLGFALVVIYQTFQTENPEN